MNLEARMAHSMTGFGRSEKFFDTRRYSVEIKSVNSRFCDVNIRMPKVFNFADANVSVGVIALFIFYRKELSHISFRKQQEEDTPSDVEEQN
jgi:uncharacterized protein YicC (UPF0701 family)